MSVGTAGLQTVERGGPGAQCPAFPSGLSGFAAQAP